jgi:predicted phage terminase large subunit-like protein
MGLLANLDAEISRRSVGQDVDAVRERCRTLHGFLREAWHVLEPFHPFVDGWAVKAICDHLEAVTRGRFTRLRINIPAGFAKSLIVSVAWNAWEWGPANLAHNRFLSTSYSDSYVTRDTRRTRDLVMSEWFQRHWPLTMVRTGETSFSNDRGGTREGAPFNRLTGGRGDRVTIDDPLSVAESRSAADREYARFIMRESVPSRVNDVARSAIVLIQHRLHREDPSGTWESLEVPHVALVLPMRFDPARACATPIFSDPRRVEGELLFPERFDAAYVRRLEIEMGAAGAASQLAQCPTSREGLMFKRQWFEGKIVNAAPDGTSWVRHWDLAATSGGDGAQTAGVKLGRDSDGRFYVGHVAVAREGGHEVRRLIRAIAQTDGYDVAISLPQDPGQAGKVQAQDLVTMLAGWNVTANPESGSKETRAQPFAAQCEAGNVFLVEGIWNEQYVDQLAEFPAAKLKDIVDATSGAFGRFVLNGSTYDSSLSWVGSWLPPRQEAALVDERTAARNRVARRAFGVD